MKKEISCPVCGSNSLVVGTHNQEFIHAGQPVFVAGLEHYDCSVCGADPIFPDQIRSNERKLVDAKKHAQGLLTASEVFAIREGLGLSQADAAQLFGGGANAFSKYERGEVVQSVPMDRLLRVASAIPYVVTFLRQTLGLAAKPAVSSQGSFTVGAALGGARVYTVGVGSAGAKYLHVPDVNVRIMEDYNVALLVHAEDVTGSAKPRGSADNSPLVTMLPVNSLPA